MTAAEMTIEEFNRFSAHETSRYAARAEGEHGQSDEAYRAKIRDVLQPEKQIEAIDASIANLNRKNGDALARHAAATSPLQRELDNPHTSADRLIECRMAVDDANGVLKADTEPINKALDAAKREREALQIRNAGKTAIENAFWAGGSEANKLRIQALRKVQDKMGPLMFAVGRMLSDAQGSLKEATGPSRRGKVDQERIAAAERQLVIAKIVSEFATMGDRAAKAEIEAIREARLAELYK